MNNLVTHYDIGRRSRHVGSLSSSAALGLSASDIVPSLVDNNPLIASQIPATSTTLTERLFNSLAEAKIWTSRVAMHMSIADRDRYFRQLDLLHDCDEWFGDDKPLLLESYKGFVRFMLMIGGKSKPSLALSACGRLIAVWLSNDDRLTIEFRDDQNVEWVVSRNEDGRIERVAGSTISRRLENNLAPYSPNGWFIRD